MARQASRIFCPTRLPIIDYLYQHLAEDLDLDGIGGRAQLADKAKPLVEKIPQVVYRELALRRLEQLIGVPLGGQGSRKGAASLA